MNSNPEVFDWKGLPARPVFQMLLEDDPQFFSILGRYEVSSNVKTDGSHEYFYRYSCCPIYDSGFYLYLEDDVPVGLISIPDHGHMTHRHEIVFLKHLFVPANLGRRGIATRMLRKLGDVASKVDELCKTKEEFCNRVLGPPCCSLLLYPNPFVFKQELPLKAIYEGQTNIDFTLHREIEDKSDDLEFFDDEMEDDSFGDLDLAGRPSATKVRQFYLDNGFVESQHFLVSNVLKNGKLQRVLNCRINTFCNPTKYPLIYPDNAEWFEKLEDWFIENVGRSEAEISKAHILGVEELCNEP